MNVNCVRVTVDKPIMIETNISATCAKCKENFQVDVTKDLPEGLTLTLLERASRDGFIMAVKRYCPTCGEVQGIPFRISMVKGLVCSKL